MEVEEEDFFFALAEARYLPLSGHDAQSLMSFANLPEEEVEEDFSSLLMEAVGDIIHF